MSHEAVHRVPPVDAIATKANNLIEVSSLVEEIAFYAEFPEHEYHRRHLLGLARKLVQALETPQETVLRLCWAEPTLYGAIITAIDCGIFIYMSKTSGSPVHVDHLAQITDTDPTLIARIMKHLAAMGVFYESGADAYLPTNLARTLAAAKYADGFPCMAQAAMKSIYNLPAYFRSTGYQNPNDATDGPFQFSYRTSQHWFAWASDHPEICQQFNNHMSAYHQGRPSWMDYDFYPVEDSLLSLMKPDPDAVLLVDVGGGLGHDLQEFQRKYPFARGRLIVQDKPDVIEQISGDLGKIEAVAHDMFTEQPIRGARAYYLHSVLHDWPDEDCYRILAQLSSAMLPGYSKLLINETIVPDQDAEWQTTGLDLMLMSLVSARERREYEWRQLLTKAGFKIVNIWSHVNGVESLIECQLVD